MNSNTWRSFQATGKYSTKSIYNLLRGEKAKVSWRNLVMGNRACPRATFILWMARHGRIPTKYCLCKFGILTDGLCVYCGLHESLKHLLFECVYTNQI